MKKIAYLIFIIFISGHLFGQQLDESYTLKINKIISKLLSGSVLPKSIKAEQSPIKHHHNFIYHTVRAGNQHLDSVIMEITIQDSLINLDFDEQHRTNEKFQVTFHYAANDKGILDWAYCGGPQLDSLTSRMKIDLKRGIADKKDIAFYEPKLKASINELYDILFKK